MTTTPTLAAAMNIIVNELRQEPYWCASLSDVTNWLSGDAGTVRTTENSMTPEPTTADLRARLDALVSGDGTSLSDLFPEAVSGEQSRLLDEPGEEPTR